jgi:thioesterase domain-containing protein/acyl carrier protein
MPSPSELRRRLRLSLPGYMVPAAFVELGELPRTPNGKLDQRRLPPPPAAGLAAGTGSATAPDLSLTPLENQLLAIWSEVLSVEHLGVDDDFFELGGHSLLAVRLVAEMERALGLPLPLVTLFERGATVRGMVSAIKALPDSKSRALAARDADARSTYPAPRLFAVFPHEASVFALRHGDGSLVQEIDVVPLVASHIGRRLEGPIADVISSTLEQVRALQPNGPYFLSGWSLGGIVAYEVAGRLAAMGESVAWLGLVDTPVPRKDSLASRALRLKTHGPRRGRALARYVWYRVGTARLRLGLSPGGIYDSEGANRALIAHELAGNQVPLELFLTDRTIQSLGATAGWAALHGGPLHVHRLPGDHNSLFRATHAVTIGEILSASIAQAVAAQADRVS